MDKAEKVSKLSVAIGVAKKNLETLEKNRLHLHGETTFWKAQLIMLENERDRLMKEQNDD